MDELLQWISSNLDVPDHIKELMKKADGSANASAALPSYGGHVKQKESDLSSDSTSESTCKWLNYYNYLFIDLPCIVASDDDKKETVGHESCDKKDGQSLKEGKADQVM